MVKLKKKENVINFKNTNGDNIKIILVKKDQIIKIKIFNSSYSFFRKRFIVLLTVIVLNLLFLIFHILNVRTVTIIFILTLLQFYILCTTIKEEMLVAVKHLGFQLTTKYTIGKKTKFIPWEQVQTVFINEVIFKLKVIYVLNLLTKDISDKERILPLFVDTLPRLACLKLLYKNLKALQD